MARYYAYRSNLDKKIRKLSKKADENKEILSKLKKSYALVDKRLKNLKNELKNLLMVSNWMVKKTGSLRKLRSESLISKNVVSMFDSELSRTLNLEINKLQDELIIVKTYYFDVLENIILNGFMHNGEKYIVYTASAGQIRTKKTVFIKESTYLKYEKTLNCGLTDEIINKRGDININKYLAYKALQNSATTRWEGFDIDKVIVVDDFETEVNSEVDFISDITFETERKRMDVLIPHTDGTGIVLPSFCNKNRMIRPPWIKGLLIPMNFVDFINEYTEKTGKYCGIVKDIYGKEYDIIKDDIQVILTKSQFKMHQYYKDWDEYKENYKKHNCHTGYCNEEEDFIKNTVISYQMLQSLTDITNEEIDELCKKTLADIDKVTKDKKTMLKLLGATPYNTNKNYYQQALQYYPQLLDDSYSKHIIKQVKRSLVNKGKSGKLKISGKYTFICPDVFAFCEWLFLGIEKPEGLLKDGEVSCNLYKDGEELDCLRSPHLYLEHCIRTNVVKEEQKKWFITKGLYTSTHDVISKIMQFDVDGDTSLVSNEKTLIDVAKRNIKKYDIVPLYYHMKKAGSMKINNKTIYKGMTDAYKGGNIGEISNNISKIWNDEVVDIEAIKIQCMLNNFVIDYAKTLYKPTKPKWVKEKLKRYSKKKLPNFFMYAKNKTRDKVESANNSTVNRVAKRIKNKPANIEKVVGRFFYTRLMKNKSVEINEDIVKKYKELEIKNVYEIMEDDSFYEENNLQYEFSRIRGELLSMHEDKYYVIDVLIKYLYMHRPTNKKLTLWNCFGDIIVENLKNDLTKSFKYEATECEVCGVLIEKTNSRVKYCSDCWKEKQKEWQRESMRKLRENRKNVK